MNRQEAREAVNQMDITQIYPFQKSKGHLYNCPICGSGTGRNKTGALQIRQGRKIRCFANECFSTKGEDNVGALRILWQCSEDEVFTKVLGNKWKEGSYSFQAKQARQRQAESEDKEMAATQKQLLDGWKERTRQFIADAQSNISEHTEALDYLKGRGITEESVKRFGLGYDDKDRSIVIPYSKANTYYICRRIRATDGTNKHRKPSGEYNGVDLKIAEPLFNLGALQSGSPVFVVESALCAISIEQTVAGAEAVALGGTGADKLIEAIKRGSKAPAFILCLDNDDAGRNAQASLAGKLKEIHANCVKYNIAGEYKDPNEALVNDEAGLIERIHNALDIANEEKEKARDEYRNKNSNLEALIKFNKKVSETKGQTCIATGMPGLDSLLEGGLYPGLHIVGAVSSLGKTTLCMQIMDSIAGAGNDVLIFSLEMDREELISKSVSRHTFQRVCASWGTQAPLRMENAKTCRGISDGTRYAGYSETELELIADAIGDYAGYANRVFIVEGLGDVGVTEIRKRVSEHISITGKKPVVLVDYLQILAPYKDPEAPNRNLTDKQAVDKNVLELKRISRDFELPVIAVSSLNRASYNSGTNMASFKESGAIEYSADVLIGLEYNGVKDSELESVIEKNAEKNAEYKPSEIKLKVLKQRAGARGASCLLDYYPMFNAFTEHGAEMNPPKDQQTGFSLVPNTEDIPF